MALSDQGHRTVERWPWEDVVGSHELAVYRAAGYGRRTQFAGSPALLVVDVTHAFVGLPLPILSSIAAYPNSCGQVAWDAVAAIGSLRATAHEVGAPVAYTVDVSSAQPPSDSVWHNKQQHDEQRRGDELDVVAEIRPVPGDIVIHKTRPSAFFGTDLAERLRGLGVRDLVVTGGTTSGCVRATVVDAFSHGFNVAVALEAVFDRGLTSHAVNLFDLNEKYCDVLRLPEARSVLTGSSTPAP